jgi:hypothetical protein
MIALIPAGVFVFFASAAALSTHTLGRTLSWAGMAVGAVSILFMAFTGPFSSEDFFGWPFLLVMLWMIVVSLRLGFARNRTAAPGPVPAPATV